MFKRGTDNDKNKDLPWVEKYRPHSLKGIIGHKWIIEALSKFVKEKKIPHMIFTGPAGTGKTSSAIALTRDLLGVEFTPEKILELNASDNVRMDTVKNEIKTFTSSMSFTRGGHSFKLIILDEADNIPKTPQHALRRIIEKSPPNVKFILMCNYENRLIDPLRSRCALFRFTLLPKNKILQRLKEIAEAEKLKFSDDYFEVLFNISSGDMRKAVNLLQMASEIGIKGKNDLHKLYNIAGFMIPQELKKIENEIIGGKFSEAVKISEINQGVSGRNFLVQLLDWIISLDLTEKQVAKIIEAIGEIDYRITEGANLKLQIQSILGFITETVYKMKR
ncbi:MAG: replication factor C small subunit [Promethearchaeota archaeon]